jgi:uncharacterized membrane-anchored protein
MVVVMASARVRYRLINNEETPTGIIKVPAIGALFWVIKVLTTGTGEAASDFLGSVSIPLAAIIGLVGFCAAMRLQMRATRYVPYLYWFAVAMVALIGTMGADVIHLAGLPYTVTTALTAVALGVIFFAWHRSEGTLSIHSINTPRREVFYWLTVLATFALGTALGDLSAVTFNLGFLPSAILFAALMAVPALAYWKFDVSAITTFWAAYVITRPLGASVADWLGKPASRSGLGVGDGPVTLAGAVLIAALVAYVTRQWMNTRRTST